MTSKRKRRQQRQRAAAVGGALAAIGGSVGAYLLRRRGAGADTIEAPPATPAAVEADAAVRGSSADTASEAAPVAPATATPPSPEEALETPEHEPPEGAAMPDTSSGDPLVDDATRAAAAQAGAIGGNANAISEDNPALAADPAARPVIEGSGDDEETFEAGEAERDREKPA